MEKYFETGEGCFFSEEDYLFNMKWEIKDLLNQGKSDEVILIWEDSDFWHENAIRVLEEIKKENIKYDTGNYKFYSKY